MITAQISRTDRELESTCTAFSVQKWRFAICLSSEADGWTQCTDPTEREGEHPLQQRAC